MHTQERGKWKNRPSAIIKSMLMCGGKLSEEMMTFNGGTKIDTLKY